MGSNSGVHEYSLFELSETQARIEYLTKLKIDPIYMDDIKAEIDKELKDLIEQYILLYAYNKLYNERDGYTGKLERYIAGDIEDKLIEKIIYLKDNKIISENEKPFNDILFKLITNNSNKSLNIEDTSSNTNNGKSNFVSQIYQPADDLKSKIQKFEAIKNNSLRSNY